MSTAPAPYAADATLVARVAAAAARTPGAVALRFEGAQLTFDELHRRSDRFAAELAARGVQHGDLVPICTERSLGLVVGLVGILKAGAAYVPLDPEHPAARIALVLDDTQARLVVAQQHSARLVEGSGRQVLLLPNDGELEGVAPPTWTPAQVRPSDLAYVIYTSGSTGRPKGVMNEHGPVVNCLDWLIKALEIGPRDVTLQKTTATFDVSVWELFIPLMTGGRMVIARPGDQRDPARLASLVVAESVTLIHFTPSALTEFLDTPSASRCSSLRAVLAMGEALAPTVVTRQREALGASLWNMYGPTEAAIFVSAHQCDVERDQQRVPIGRAIANARLYVVNSAGALCPTGEAGELWIGGVPVARGYLGRQDLTLERFAPDPFCQETNARIYRTGDRARLRPDGELDYLGRLDDQVKVRGVRVEPGEVEATLLALPGVREAAVIAQEDPVRGTTLLAYAAPRHEAPTPTEAGLLEALRVVLPAALVPSRIVVLAELPRTSSGKLDRKALPTPPPPTPMGDTEDGAPTTETESQVLAIWRAVLATPHLGMEHDFLRSGGHSLLAMRIAARIEAALGVAIPVRDVLTARTARALTALIERARGSHERETIAKIPRDRPTVLSPGQLDLWLEHRLDPGDAAFHVPLAMRLVGNLDTAALGRAVTTLVNRHEALRTRFIEQGGTPAQVVEPMVVVNLEYREALGATAESVEQILRAESRRAFDLAQGPPCRVLLLATGARQHVLLLCFHHIVIDEWSLGVLLREIGPLYHAEVAGRVADLPAPDLQMPDVAAWLHARPPPSGPADEEASDLGLPPPLGQAAGPTGGRIEAELPAGLALRLVECAAREASTPFEVTLAAYLVLLRKLTSRGRVTVGTPRTVREGPELESVVGYLLEMAPVTAHFPPGSTFRDVLAQVRGVATSPAGRTGPGGGRRPFDAVFVFLHDPAEAAALGDVEAVPVPTWTGDPKYGLSLELRLRKGRLACIIEYTRSRLAEEVGTTLSMRFAALLGQLIDDPSAPVADATLLVDPERHRVLEEWNGPQRPLPAAPSIHRAFERQAAKAPDRVAAQWGQECWTYERLDARANQLARALVAAGVQPGDRVPVLVDRSPQMLAAFLGVLKAGACYAPLDPSDPPARRTAMLSELAHRVLISDTQHATPAGPNAPHRIQIEDPALDLLDSQPLAHDGASDAPAYVMFTSGSTGTPKGVVVPHIAVLRLVHGQDFAALDADRTWLHLAPPWFDASTLEVWAPLLNGGRCVVFPDPIPALEDLARAIHDHAVDSLWLTSALFNTIVDHDTDALRGLRQLLVGGEALSPNHVRRAQAAHPGLRIVNGYGPTENTTFTTCHPIGPADLTVSQIPIGRPIANTRAYVLDADGTPVPAGVPGELWAGGLGVALGYLGRPVETADRFVPDPFDPRPGARMYRTGDLVRWRPDGVLDFLARRDRQVKVRGHRIELGEVEAALAAHPSVRSAVVELHDPHGATPQLVGWFVPRDPNFTPTRAELAEHVAACLPRHMVPSALVPIGAIPLTPSGKVDRVRLPRPVLSTRAGALEDPARRTPIEQRLLTIWREVLATDAVGVDDDFFSLGGTSLLAIRMVARVEKELASKVSMRTVLDAPTIRQLAQVMGGEAARPGAEVVIELRAHATGAPLFCVPGLGGHVFSYRKLLEHLPPDRPVFGLQVQELADRPELLTSLESLSSELVRQMRATRAVGPYYLLGYSFGGNVAFEMARQLEAAGVANVLLVLIDAYLPGSIRSKTGLPKLRAHLREFTRQSPRGMWDYVATRVRRRLGIGHPAPSTHVPAPTAGTSLEARVAAVEHACRMALNAYVPTPIKCPTVLLRAMRLSEWSVVNLDDLTYGWGPYFQGGLHIHSLDCEHLRIFDEPYITELGRRIHQACMDGEGRLGAARASAAPPDGSHEVS